MTSLLAAPVAAPDDDRPARRVDWFAAAQILSLVVAVVVLDRVVLPDAGGRATGVTAWHLISVVPALMLTRPWRLPNPVLLAGLALPLSSFLVCVFAPMGWSGVQRPVEVTYAVVVALSVAAFATTGGRRLAALIVVGLLALDEFGQGWLAWWGGENPAKPMVGTFYWHNQFGAFLVPGVVLGLAMTTHGPRTWRKVGYVVTPVSAAGVLYSTSRASMMMAGIGGLLVLATAIRMQDRWGRVRRWLVTAALSGAVSTFLVTPLFFPHWSSPFAAAAQRNAQESLSGNTGARLDFWIAGWHAFIERPLTGSGFGGYPSVSQWFLPPNGLSTFPHNDLVRVFVEGGLLAGLPELAVLVALVVLAVRNLRTRTSTVIDETVAVGASIAVLAALGHALVDFDWAYPALMAQFAILAGLVVAVRTFGPTAVQPAETALGSRGHPTPLRRPVIVAIACSAVLVVAVAASVSGTDQRAVSTSASGTGASSDPNVAMQALLQASRSRLASPWTRLAALQFGASHDLLSPREATTLLRATDGLASVDGNARVERDLALMQLGHLREALADARALAKRDYAYGSPFVRAYALLLARAGETSLAAEVAARETAFLSTLPAVWLGQTRSTLQLLGSLGYPGGSRCTADVTALLARPGKPSVRLGLPASCGDLLAGPVVP